MKQQKKRKRMNGNTVPRIILRSEGLEEEQSVSSSSHMFSFIESFTTLASKQLIEFNFPIFITPGARAFSLGRVRLSRPRVRLLSLSGKSAQNLGRGRRVQLWPGSLCVRLRDLGRKVNRRSRPRAKSRTRRPGPDSGPISSIKTKSTPWPRKSTPAQNGCSGPWC